MAKEIKQSKAKKAPVKRKGVVAKKGTSKNKGSKLYKKPTKGQG